MSQHTDTEASPSRKAPEMVELVGGPLCGLEVEYKPGGSVFTALHEGRIYGYLLEPNGRTAIYAPQR